MKPDKRLTVMVGEIAPVQQAPLHPVAMLLPFMSIISFSSAAPYHPANGYRTTRRTGHFTRIPGRCRRQFAKYTCPTCNVPYCSLTCFRSQAHNQCSEGFYKKEIEKDIHATGPSKTAQERQKMMDLLKKFEEDSSRSETLEDRDSNEDEDEDPEGLARRFGALDFDSTSPDMIWAMLTPEERKKFMKAFEDPTSELAQQLLASEQLEQEIQEAWWEDTALSEDDGPNHGKIPRRFGARPTMMDIPESMIKPIPEGHPLVYNMCAVCIAYAYITRHLGTSPLERLKIEDPEHYEARRLISQLVPFLTDRMSKTLYPNLTSVITDIWSLCDLGTMTSDLFSLLLHDAARLLKPLRVVEVQTETREHLLFSQSHRMPVLVLSDIHALFSTKPTGTKGHVTHKLRFYAAHIISTPSVILEGLVGEIVARAGQYKSETGQQKSLVTVRVAKDPEERPRKLVEEI